MYINNRYDTLQKLALLDFAQAMLIATGDIRKVVRFYPTELIIPTFQNKFMDGVLELNDGTLLNIEFQTGNLTEKFLRRCAQYAVNLSVVSGREVETKIFSTGYWDESATMVEISKKFKFEPEIFFYSEFNGLEKLINIKNKIKNSNKLTEMDFYDLIFIPLMGNIDKTDAAFEFFRIVNDSKLFTEEQQSKIKQCQYIVAYIVAGDDEETFNKFMGEITMFADFLVDRERELVENAWNKGRNEGRTEGKAEGRAEGRTEGLNEGRIEMARKVAGNLKDHLDDESISDATGLSLEEVKKIQKSNK